MLTKDNVIEVLKKVEDPEIQLDVWTLGLIYEVKVDEGKVFVKMTFTSMACPYGPMLVSEIQQKIAELNGVKDVRVEVTFDPVWQPSEELRAMLGV
ncbi:metal-sulfur cluster assembly factor [Candidatus Woesearchaeota archaeon]|nr:metal-sulfur cluster assembly factor [Candidatus Woesearchaeota archaeon]